MGDSVYLAWRYLRFQRWKTLLLIVSITIVLFLPAALYVLQQKSARQLRARARATPLIVGAKGSALELVLHSLYFESNPPPLLTMAASERIGASRLAQPIPLYARFRAPHGTPIVGTTLDYFRWRDLQLTDGRMFGRLGQCVVGAEAAQKLQLRAGSSVVSTPETFFNLAGVYPLKMEVAGVLAPTGGPDDRAIFVDVKTAWIIEGLGHGHQDLATAASGQLLRRENNEVTANASVLQYTEITDENAASFHFHGDRSTFPLSAVIAVPNDLKSETLLLGRFQSPDEALQIVKPAQVMEQLIRTVFTIGAYVLAAAALVCLATFLATGLIFLLSIKVRQREIETLLKIGASRWRIAGILVSEILLTLSISGLLAGALTWAAAYWSDAMIRLLIL